MARLLRLTLLGLPVGLVLPSPALAAHASATASHGPPGAVYGGRTSQDHPMSLRLTGDGRRLRSFTVHVDAGMCSSSPTTYTLAFDRHFNSLHPARVRADGSFANTGRFRAQTQGGQKLDFEVDLTGKAGRTRAVGTIRFFGPVSDPNGNVVDRCDSGPVRWTLDRGMVYGGVTADHTPLSIRLDRGGRRLKSFFIDLQFVCAGTKYLLSLDHLNVAVRRDGSFSKRGFTGIPFKVPGGSLASGQFSLRGKLGSQRASGSYRAFGTVRRSDGSTASCDTGAVRWTAWRG